TAFPPGPSALLTPNTLDELRLTVGVLATFMLGVLARFTLGELPILTVPLIGTDGTDTAVMLTGATLLAATGLPVKEFNTMASRLRHAANRMIFASFLILGSPVRRLNRRGVVNGRVIRM